MGVGIQGRFLSENSSQLISPKADKGGEERGTMGTTKEKKDEPKKEPGLFDYLDYRSYLRDFYDFKKKTSPAFSLNTFAQKAGFSSRSFLLLVMQGKRDITPNSIDGFCRALGLGKKEREYFENLIRFNQSENAEAKRHYYEQLVPLYKKESGRRLHESEYQYISQWYGPVIREMIQTKNFREEPEWIARQLKNRISPLQAKKTLQLLLELGLVRRSGRGKLEVTDVNIGTPTEVADAMAAKFHDEMLGMARQSIAEDDANQREISGITTALSAAKFARIKEAIQEFENKIMHELEEKDDEADRIYQLHFQLFPLTRIDEKAR